MNARLHHPPPPARPLPARAGVVDHVRPSPRTNRAGHGDLNRSVLRQIMSFASHRCDDWRHSSGPSVGLPRTSVWICWALLRYLLRSPTAFLSMLLAGWHPAARPQYSYNVNGYRYHTILRQENGGRWRTQLQCFAACRRLLLRALNNRRSGVNTYPQCRLRWLVLGRNHSTRPDSTRLSWNELSQVGHCTHDFRP